MLKVDDMSVSLNEKFSLHSLFERSVEKYGDMPCMALSHYTKYPPNQRKEEPKFDPVFEYQTYKQIGDLVKNIAASLIALNLEKTPCDEGEEPRVKVGFWCATSFEMRVAMMACHKAGFVVVPVYETLSTENVISIFELTQISLIFTDTKAHYLESIKYFQSHDNVKYLIKIKSNQDRLENVEQPKLSEETIPYETLSKFSGNLEDFFYPEVSGNDIAFIFSTSGSTGKAKCVKQSHDSIACVALAAAQNFRSTFIKFSDRGDQLTTFSFLPQAHIYGQISDFMFYINGGKIAYPSGSAKSTLLSDISAIKPHMLVIAPLILKRIYDTTNAKLNASLLKKMIFNFAFTFKKITNLALFDFAFSKLRKLLGNNVSILFSGGAPISDELFNFATYCLGVKLVQGYGLTEGILTLQPFETSRKCNLGAPLSFIDCKLSDVPELGYYAEKKQGELCVKGRSIFKGYYNLPDMSKEVYDSDGYFKTGDIVEEIFDNKVKVYRYLDRAKNIFKLSNGEYVVPYEIENVFLKSDIFAQVYIHGDSYKSFCIAIGFIEPIRVKEVISRINEDFDISNMPELTDLESLDEILLMNKKNLFDHLNSFSKSLARYKVPKNWFFTCYLPSLENGLLTPTMKERRHLIAQHFSVQIDQMIAEVEND